MVFGMTQKRVMVAIGAAGFALALSGAAHAVSVTTTSYSQPYGGDSLTVYYPGKTLAGGGSSVTTTAGLIQQNLRSGNALGVSFLSTYCVDLFHYTAAPTTYQVGAAGTTGFNSITSQTGSTAWTTQQLNILNALLYNGSLQTQNATNTAAMQIAIWEIEYAPILTSYSSSVLTNSSSSFYFSGIDSATMTQAVTYLNNVVGASPTWTANASYYVGELTYSTITSGVAQSLIYLASVTPGNQGAPEPSTIALFGVGLLALWAWRRKYQMVPIGE